MFAIRCHISLPAVILIAKRRSYATGARTTYDYSAVGISRRCADHLESMHPAGIAVRLCPLGAKIPDERVAPADRDGGDVRRNCHLGRRRRRLGGACESIWPAAGAGLADCIRCHAAVAPIGGSVGAALR